MTATCARSLVVLALLDFAALQWATAKRSSERQPTSSRPANSWREKLDRWKVRRVFDPGNFSAFCRQRMFGEIAQGKMTLLLHDNELGARDIRDPRSKFVIIRSRNAKDNLPGERVLGIPTPRASSNQPVHLYDIDRSKSHHLGRMLRGVLTAIEKVRPPSDGCSYRGWVADIHLPLSLTMPVLHVHGEFAPTLLGTFGQPGYQPKLGRWDTTLQRLGYRRRASDRYDVYAAAPARRLKNMDVVGVAKTRMTDFLRGDRTLDASIGEMILDVAATALRRGTTLGYLVVERDSQQVVAKVVTSSNMTPAP